MSGSVAFDAYVEALALLGLQPGATRAEIEKANRTIQFNCHPDRFPGDAEKEARSKAANAAADLLILMIRDGRAQTFAARAERSRRTGPIPTKGPLLVVLVVMAPAGMGKTQGWVGSVSQRGRRQPGLMQRGSPLHVIFAAPTISLIDQTRNDLASGGLRAPVVTVVHAECLPSGVSVATAMRAYFLSVLQDEDAVLLCSHQAVFATPMPPDPENWDLVFDEMPECVSFLSIDAPITHFLISSHVITTDVGGVLYRLSIGHDDLAADRLNRIAINRPFDGGVVHLREFARALVNGHDVMVPKAQWDELVQRPARSKYAGHVDILVIVPPTWFRRHRSVTMMGARCMSHFTALVWRKLWGVEFRPDDRFGLPETHTRAQGRRLTIHWIFKERVTRAFLNRKAASGDRMFMAVCKAVARHYGRAPFLWSAPQPRTEVGDYGVKDDFWRSTQRSKAFDPLLRLPGRSHGLNEPVFLGCGNVALLSVVNLTPVQYQLLHMLEITNEDIDRALSFDVAYQDMARSNIRLTKGTMPVDVTVLDEATALDLAEKFPGCKVERYPEELIPSGMKRGRPPSGSAQSNADRQRAWRARQAALRAKQEDVDRET